MKDVVEIRRYLHQHPELGLSEFHTSDYVAGKLEAMGYEVTRGLARTGIVATLRNGTSQRSLGLRADFDALPITEETGLDYASLTPGLMHACGHDGHTAMLLGAAGILAERRNFDGVVHLIFQPAEENFGGARLMIEDGLFERFPCDAVFGLHNDPGIAFGHFAFREGPIMASVDECKITVIGRGGHGAEPQSTSDPIVAGASIIMALQTIASRNIHPLDPVVVTVGAFHAGAASNVIPERADMVLTIRSFDDHVRDELENRVRAIAEGQAASYGMTVEIDYERGYPATVNHKAETDYVRDLARRFAGEGKVFDMPRPTMGGEDFAYMLQEKPGTYFFLGTKRTENDPPLHHPRYDFNDDIIPTGTAFWVDLVESRLKLE
ncbi:MULTISPECIES: M20 aminoacylase family protein [Rhizobium/Agrobacterium group]|uniref:M20 aminoacylase family protein n=1 Tax=Rhizobium/Agrobacterium group TaxID=227290 RepID=UPI000B40557B|nr:amidohydrolase [Allorhizobium ampelinum]MVA72302.1 amidohydrolase [Agrobacterium vitis]NSZ44303.1 amidohydrolase [Agrobacterium vitis]NTA28050.1 amidohydrolase [Allorhizobium ampelinum]OVE93868.1 amidohydrolase [Allorhizobium ampelinum]